MITEAGRQGPAKAKGLGAMQVPGLRRGWELGWGKRVAGAKGECAGSLEANKKMMRGGCKRLGGARQLGWGG